MVTPRRRLNSYWPAMQIVLPQELQFPLQLEQMGTRMLMPPIESRDALDFFPCAKAKKAPIGSIYARNEKKPPGRAHRTTCATPKITNFCFQQWRPILTPRSILCDIDTACSRLQQRSHTLAWLVGTTTFAKTENKCLPCCQKLTCTLNLFLPQ